MNPKAPGVVVLLALALWLPCAGAQAARKTVCTITVNSADEKETMRRQLPPGEFDFIELVERGRPDWLASACSRRVACDVLVISGHYDGGHEFFADSLEKNEFLPVDELERVACSDSCPALFSQLKEVYLFGCNTLNPDANRTLGPEIGRSLARAGHSRAEIERMTRSLAARHGESSRDRMRLIFKDVPAIYGFSSVAPLGPEAANNLQRYLGATRGSEVGTGRQSSRLLASFAGRGMTVTNGLGATEPQAAHRADVCRFADDRLSVAARLAFVHELLRRDATEVRMFLDRLERETALSPEERARPEVAAQLAAIAADEASKRRYFVLVDDVDDLATRLRMLHLAAQVDWLSPVEHDAGMLRAVAAQVEQHGANAADVETVCRLADDLPLDDAVLRVAMSPDRARGAAGSAMLACMGDADARQRVLRFLTSGSDGDASIAQVYLRHRPLAGQGDVRDVTADIARMTTPAAQARALDALAASRIADHAALDAVARLYPVANSPAVQNAIAGVLIRADYSTLDQLQLAQTLKQYRLKAGASDDLVGVLLRRPAPR
ncbi:MAG: hypothetical protein ABI812_04560 [Betaproteobacteria bacterium]